MRAAPHHASRLPNFFWKRLAIRPYCSIFKVFFLPDRHRLLERVNDPPASLKRRVPVSPSHHDQHACLPDLQPPQPVDDGRSPHPKTRPRLRRQRLHLLQRHGFIGFIVQIERPPPARVVPHHAVENHRRAVPLLLQPPYYTLGIHRRHAAPDSSPHFVPSIAGALARL